MVVNISPSISLYETESVAAMRRDRIPKTIPVSEKHEWPVAYVLATPSKPELDEPYGWRIGLRLTVLQVIEESWQESVVAKLESHWS
jgi:hypothetical protein